MWTASKRATNRPFHSYCTEARGSYDSRCVAMGMVGMVQPKVRVNYGLHIKIAIKICTDCDTTKLFSSL